MDWIAAILLWIGNFIIIKYKHWSAWFLFAIANTMWAVWWFSHKEWAAFFLVCSFLVQNAWGIYQWKFKSEKG